MESAFKDWDYIEGMIDSAYHEAALKMNLSDSEFSILYIFNEHQEGCNQSAFYKESCMTKFCYPQDGKKGTSLSYARKWPQYTGFSY